LIKNSQPFAENFQKTARGEFFDSHSDTLYTTCTYSEMWSHRSLMSLFCHSATAWHVSRHGLVSVALFWTDSSPIYFLDLFVSLHTSRGVLLIVGRFVRLRAGASARWRRCVCAELGFESQLTFVSILVHQNA